MNSSRKLAGLVVITSLLAMMTIVMLNEGYLSNFAMVSFIFSFLVSALVINWVGDGPDEESESQRKVEKVLREFDDNDLELLRSRLMNEDAYDEREYGSIAEMIHSRKRKNEDR